MRRSGSGYVPAARNRAACDLGDVLTSKGGVMGGDATIEGAGYAVEQDMGC